MNLLITDKDFHIIRKALQIVLNTTDLQNNPTFNPDYLERFLTYMCEAYEKENATNSIARWIDKLAVGADPNSVYYQCSNCEQDSTIMTSYCCRCGCRMVNAVRLDEE